MFALKNNNLVRKMIWSVRDAVDARLRNNSPSETVPFCRSPFPELSPTERDLTFCREPNT
jgi:hypothetical protein